MNGAGVADADGPHARPAVARRALAIYIQRSVAPGLLPAARPVAPPPRARHRPRARRQHHRPARAQAQGARARAASRRGGDSPRESSARSSCGSFTGKEVRRGGVRRLLLALCS